ncbi:MAG: dihydrolipoyl dehydrogenase [Chitinispirillales bacterium]|jgi:dihydrolipoamide dehydrogenase|nr:dihydrolipoyl dehydrogenase [Chitinispirillales bacterium]
MPHNYDYDALIIGSGPGGYVAAIRAAQLGQKVAVVEKGALGGVCLNIGCIPTKSIIHQAEIFRGRSKLTAMGVAVDDSGFKYENVFNVSRRTADGLSKGVAYLLKKNNVEVIIGAARLVSSHEVAVDGADGSRTVTARAVIAATGSRPRIIPGLEFDGKRILSSDDALMLKELPRRALIVGSGAIGVEFAHIMNAFGVEVHLVEMMERILPLDDGEVTALLTRLFTKRGIKVYTSAKISSHKINGESIDAVIDGAGGNMTALSVDKIFVMAGRTPNTDSVGFENLGIDTSASNGFIETGDYYQTAVKSVYAIGDIIASSPLLAHAASAEGEIAAEHIAGHKPRAARVDIMSIPGVVYCEPQTASFGLTEEQAVSQNVPFVKAAFPYRGCGKAVATDAADGMVKLLASPSTKKILGAHIIGSNASELIHELLLARNAGITPAQIATMIHAHPTLSETIMEAARAIEGWAVHA